MPPQPQTGPTSSHFGDAETDGVGFPPVTRDNGKAMILSESDALIRSMLIDVSQGADLNPEQGWKAVLALVYGRFQMTDLVGNDPNDK